jgi:hypothetical protein
MKRSEVNAIIDDAKSFFDEMKFPLPPWAYWAPADWKGAYDRCAEIIDNMLGWDITDFGSNKYEKRGLLLFTLRNGNPKENHKPYAEKIMIVHEDQETPFHFHWAKMEDIINRGGGNLVIELYGSTKNEEFSDEPVTVRVDGVERTVDAGGTVILTPGESICLEQGMYHRFYGEPGKGRVLVGEVSAVNDDNVDNRFKEELGRFPALDEDEPPVHLLVSDYRQYL